MKILWPTVILAHCLALVAQTQERATPDTIRVVLQRPYDKFTVSEGESILGILDLLGFDKVESFQAEKGLTVDGVVGPATYTAAVEELKKRGLHRATNQSAPLEIRMVSIDGGVIFAISNRTDHVLVVADVGSLISVSNGSRQLGFPVTALGSGEIKPGTHVRRGDRTLVQVPAPLSIKPRGVFQKTLPLKPIGKGVTELRVRFVAEIDQGRVVIIESIPLVLQQLMEFDAK